MARIEDVKRKLLKEEDYGYKEFNRRNKTMSLERRIEVLESKVRRLERRGGQPNCY